MNDELVIIGETDDGFKVSVASNQWPLLATRAVRRSCRHKYKDFSGVLYCAFCGVAR